MNKLWIAAAALGGAAALAAGCGGTSEAGGGASGSGSTKLALAAYSTPREAYAELIPAFAATPAGRGVSISQSYGSSGEQSRAVEAGLPADVVAFSLAPDVIRLVEAGIVAPDWAADGHHGMVTDSVVVLAVRKGNPKGIRGWDDLVQPGVEVITPNPFTSGGARWNVMAAYGAQLEQGKSKQQAVQYLRDLFANVSVQDKSARESLQTFSGGKGDVLIAYENEAITAQQAGQPLEYVIPDQTILIENPVAVTKDAPAQAKAFVDYLRTPAAQRVFAAKGYRSILPALADEARYPTPQTLFSIAYLGGWDAVTSEFFDREDGIVADIQRDLGEPTE
ncbi:MAG: sulfate ABC transporter substrate-binding protein [Pseudomonadota bacterium]